MLSILLALVMVIGVFPVYADDANTDMKASEQMTAQEAGDVLVGYGAIKGTPTGDLMINEKLKRQDAVVILSRLMGKAEEAMAYEGKTAFEDIKNPYYEPFIGYAFSNSWIKGRSETSFGYNDSIKYQEFVAMMLRSLGYFDVTAEDYSKVVEKAHELGLDKGISNTNASSELLRGDIFIIMNNALETVPKDGTKKLVYVLNYKEEPVAETLSVVSVAPNGLKVINVEFSKAVDEKSLDTIKVRKATNRRNENIMDRLLSEDGKTVFLVLETAPKQDTVFTVIIDAVKSEDRKETVERYEGQILMTDTERPEILSAEALNPKMIKFVTSEPINIDGKYYKTQKNIEIDGRAVYGKIMNVYKNEFTVELSRALAPKDYEVSVKKLYDFQGLEADPKTFTITVVEDNEAPIVVDSKMLTTKEVKVTFNEPLSYVGMFRVDGNMISKSNVKLEKDMKTVSLTLNRELNMSAIVEVKVEYRAQKDIVGNTVKNWEKFIFSVADDTSLPTAEIDWTQGNRVAVKFDKAMDNVGTYILREKGKSSVQVKGKVTDGKGRWYDEKNGYVFVFDVLKNQNAKAYELELLGFRDGSVRHNELPKTVLEFESGDTKEPKIVDNVAITNVKENYIKVLFDETMNVETLLEPSNYNIDGIRLDLFNGFDYISVDNNDKAVVIYLKVNDKNEFLVSKYKKLEMVGLKDLAGNRLNGGSETVDIQAEGNDIVLRATDIVKDGDDFYAKLVFSSPVTLARDSANLEVTAGGRKYDAVYIGSDQEYSRSQMYLIANYKYNNEDTVVLLNMPNNMFESETKAILDKDAANSTLSYTLTDRVKPERATDKYGIVDAFVKASNPSTVVVPFNEDIAADSVQVVVRDGNGDLVKVNTAVKGKDVEITLANGIFTAESKYRLESVQVADEHGNLAKFEDVVINLRDLEGKMAAKSILIDGNSVQVEFEKPIEDASKVEITVNVVHNGAKKEISLNAATLDGTKKIATAERADGKKFYVQDANYYYEINVKYDGKVYIANIKKGSDLEPMLSVELTSAKIENTTGKELVLEYAADVTSEMEAALVNLVVKHDTDMIQAEGVARDAKKATITLASAVKDKDTVSTYMVKEAIKAEMLNNDGVNCEVVIVPADQEITNELEAVTLTTKEIEAAAKTAIKLVFSRDVTKLSEIKVVLDGAEEGHTIAVDPTHSDAKNFTLTRTDGKDFIQGRTYKVSFVVDDYKTFTDVAVTNSSDTTEPTYTVSDIKATSATELSITIAEDITALKDSIKFEGKLQDAGSSSDRVDFASATPTVNVTATTITLTFDADVFTSEETMTETEAKMTLVDSDGKKIDVPFSGKLIQNDTF